jgi:hypothetical protein
LEERLTFQNLDALLLFGYVVEIGYVQIISLRKMNVAKLVWGVLIQGDALRGYVGTMRSYQ